MRGIEAELDGGLIGGLSEVGEEVADFLLASIDDLASGGGVDGGSHTLTKLLEAATHLPAGRQVCSRRVSADKAGDKAGSGDMSCSCVAGQTGVAPGLLSRAFLST